MIKITNLLVLYLYSLKEEGQQKYLLSCERFELLLDIRLKVIASSSVHMKKFYSKSKAIETSPDLLSNFNLPLKKSL